MPSKRRVQIRQNHLIRDGWSRLTEDMWRARHEKLGKPKLLADANFPITLTQALRREKIDIKTAQELGLERLNDQDLLARATRLRRILITMDGDFWSEKNFPLHRSYGIVFVASGNAFNSSRGFYTLVGFLKVTGGEWTLLKIKASADRVFLKLKEVNGKVNQFELKIFTGTGAFVREVSDEDAEP